MEILKCLGTGIITGAFFGVLRLPIPAPIVIEGVIGIVGIFIGYQIVLYWLNLN